MKSGDVKMAATLFVLMGEEMSAEVLRFLNDENSYLTKPGGKNRSQCFDWIAHLLCPRIIKQCQYVDGKELRSDVRR